MNEHWRQSPEWEELFQTVINKAKRCPATALCFSNSITAEKVEDAAGNHVFDDHFDFWEISENQGTNCVRFFNTILAAEMKDSKNILPI